MTQSSEDFGSERLDKATKDSILDSITQEANGFYNSLLTIATAFLGGSLLFLKELLHTLPPRGLFALYIGWIGLTTCLVLMVLVRFLNLVSGKHALARKTQDAQKLDYVKEWLCIIALAGLAIGLSSLMIFGAINIPISKIDEREAIMAEKKEKDSGIKKRGYSIPYGETDKPITESISYGETGSPQPSQSQKPKESPKEEEPPKPKK